MLVPSLVVSLTTDAAVSSSLLQGLVVGSLPVCSSSVVSPVVLLVAMSSVATTLLDVSYTYRHVKF